MAELKVIVKIELAPLEKEFGKIVIDEIVVTDERLAHIRDSCRIQI